MIVASGIASIVSGAGRYAVRGAERRAGRRSGAFVVAVGMHCRASARFTWMVVEGNMTAHDRGRGDPNRPGRPELAGQVPAVGKQTRVELLDRNAAAKDALARDI